MSYREQDIVHENPTHWVLKNKDGHFEVYRTGITHSTRRAYIGFPGPKGLEKARDEADRRHALEATA